MLSYEEFKKVVTEKIKDFLPKEFADYNVEIHSIQKVNNTLDSLNIIPSVKEVEVFSPSVYINDMYDSFKKCEDLREVLLKTANTIEQAFHMIQKEGIPNVDFSRAKDNIIMILVNTEKNSKLIENAPHRPFEDLSIIYRLVVEADLENRVMKSIIVQNNILEKIHLTEDELYHAAVQNTKRILPPSIQSMQDVLINMMLESGMPKEILQGMLEDIPYDKQMYRISNEIKINGAVNIVYDEILYELAEKLESDIYILPSSIHETIVVSSKYYDLSSLKEIVAQVNQEVVDVSEQLSDTVYYYDKSARTLTSVNDVQTKEMNNRKESR